MAHSTRISTKRPILQIYVIYFEVMKGNKLDVLNCYFKGMSRRLFSINLDYLLFQLMVKCHVSYQVFVMSVTMKSLVSAL